MSGIAVDNPGCIIDWFTAYPPGERARKVTGDCPHACQHRVTKTVGWGGDLTHYELHVCDDPDGCAGNCRGWMAGTGASSYQLMRQIPWKLLAGAR